MNNTIFKKIEYNDDIKIKYDNNILSVTGKNGTLNREFYFPNVNISILNGKITINTNEYNKKTKSIIGTYVAHIKNMIKGVTEGFEYRMSIVYSHFPMQTKVENNKFIINNFLGEKKSRIAKIIGDTKVKINGNSVIISGISKEDVGQTAANIENRCKIKKFDPRVFQDGIYITKKWLKMNNNQKNETKKMFIDFNVKRLFNIRKIQKKKKPKFNRYCHHKFKKLNKSWRKPRGLQSKQRKKILGKGHIVSIGYGSPVLVSKLHPSGYQEHLINNIYELQLISTDIEAIRIASSVGMKKKIEIIKKAKEMNIKILNPFKEKEN